MLVVYVFYCLYCYISQRFMVFQIFLHLGRLFCLFDSRARIHSINQLPMRNGKRVRRIVAFCLTLVGAISGGCITRATGDIAPVLWIAAGIKAVFVVLWVVWKEYRVCYPTSSLHIDTNPCIICPINIKLIATRS